MSSLRSQLSKLQFPSYLMSPLTLPSQRFFEPNEKFTEWVIANLKNHVIYDIGAGNGHVSKLLMSLGIMVYPIDIHNREDPEYPVVISDATVNSYIPLSVIMFCRPNHSGFVEETITQALKHEASMIIYISKPINRHNDLGKYYRKSFLQVKKVGQDGESLYTISDICHREGRRGQ